MLYAAPLALFPSATVLCLAALAAGATEDAPKPTCCSPFDGMPIATDRPREEPCIILAAGKATCERPHGQLKSFSADGGAIVQPQGAEPLRFAPGAVSAVAFDRPAKVAPDGASAYFNNGDALPGDIVSLSPEKLVMRTDASQVEIPADRVRTLDLAADVRTVVDLIGNPKDWRPPIVRSLEPTPPPPPPGLGELHAVPGQLTLTEGLGISRAVPFPASYTLTMEYEAAAEDGNFQLELLRTTAREEIKGGKRSETGNGHLVCSLSFDKGHGKAGVRWITNSFAMGNSAEQAFALPPAKGARRQLRWETNQENGTITLWSDGVRVGAFENKHPLRSQDFSLKASSGKLAITRLTMEAGPAVPPVASAPDTDLLTLVNGDCAKGAVRGIADGKVAFESDGHRQEIPVARVRRILFSSRHDRMPAADPAAGSFFFDDFRSLALRVDSVEDGVVHGVSPVIGKCAIPVEAARRILFQKAPGR